MPTQKYRLLTRIDFDGLVCAVLLKELDLLGDISFVHPKDVQDGKVDVTENDILTNLPYVDGCHLCFDHHASEEIRNCGKDVRNYVLQPEADSAARVVYNHFGGADRFSNINGEMIEAVDKADSARFTIEEVTDPSGWELLSFLMDARTGLGRFRNFRISNYQLMMALIDDCRKYSIEQILDLLDVRERIDLYNRHRADFEAQIHRCSTVHDNLVVLDLRDEDVIYPGNRFMIYAMHPQCNVSIHVIWGLKQQNTVFAIGKSIFDRTCPTDISELALQYGGGGHEAAGTCQIANDDAERVLGELIDRMTSHSGARELVTA